MFAEVISSVILIIIIHLCFRTKETNKVSKFFKDLLQCLMKYKEQNHNISL
jgi:hypothetical protein